MRTYGVTLGTGTGDHLVISQWRDRFPYTVVDFDLVAVEGI